MASNPIRPDDWLNLLDLDAVADLSDKFGECKFFLSLVERESDRDKFRWLISAFFGACYSYFEISAVKAYESFCHPETGEFVESEKALTVLRKYVKVSRGAQKPYFIKTSGHHEITKEFYQWRRKSTHYYPTPIMVVGESAPYNFQLGAVSGKGVPALEFCNQLMGLIAKLESELSEIL